MQPLLNTSEKLNEDLKTVSTNNADQLTTQWRIQGRGQGARAPPLFLAQTEARRAEKNFVLETARPTSLSKGLDDRGPPYLKVWIPPCNPSKISKPTIVSEYFLTK